MLLVEDHQEARGTLAELLETLGHRVETVGGPGELAQPTAAPEVVIVSLDLPDADGTQLLRDLRSRPGWQHVRAIAVSADDEQLGPAEDAGFDCYLMKPLALRELDHAVYRLAFAS